jgi:lipopolysaccharide assembly outer membrane protein LptD (OstA)
VPRRSRRERVDRIGRSAVGWPPPEGGRAIRRQPEGIGRRCGPRLVPRRAAAAIALAIGLAAGVARADDFDAPFQVDADEVEYQAERDLYVARGHVVLTQQGRTLRADRVYFSNRTRQGVASGNVVVQDGGDTLRAPFLQFNIDSTKGVVLDGELDSAVGGYKMQGREVRKTGDQTYEFVDARFTTCRCPKKDERDPWAVTAKTATLDLDGYGRAHNSTLQILGVPVFWVPYAVYPLKRERQTGFLFPQVGTSSRTGGDITLPFFWAIRENVDLTLEGQYQVKRGFKPSALLEYVYGETAKGEVYGTYIDDQDINPDDTATPFGSQRWGARWEHAQDLPWASRTAVDAVAISDNQFPFDFADFRHYRRDRFLHSTGWAGSHFDDDMGRFGVAFSAQRADDLQNPDDQDRDQFLLQRLPELQVAALPDRMPGIPGLLVSSGLEFVNYQPLGSADSHFGAGLRDARDQFYDVGIDAIADGQERNNAGVKTPGDNHKDDAASLRGGPEGNGRFDEGEPLADHGQRVIAHPRIAYPVQLGDVVELYPEAGYYGTFYQADRSGTDQRSLFTGRVDLRTRVRGKVQLPGLGLLSHTVEPFLGWVGISNTDQDDNPLFVPTTAVPQDRLRLLERDNVTLDPSDRIEDANDIVFGVGNRLARLDGGMQTEIKLLTEYRAAQAKWGDAVLQGSTGLPYGVWMRFHGVLDLEQTEFTDGLVDLSWGRRGHKLSIGYRYVRDIPQVFENFVRNDRFEDFLDGFTRINQISGSARLQATRSWALTYNGYYSFDNAISLINQFGIEYLSKCNCWAVRFEVSEDRTRGVDWTIQYRLVGLGEPPERVFAH